MANIDRVPDITSRRNLLTSTSLSASTLSKTKRQLDTGKKYDSFTQCADNVKKLKDLQSQLTSKFKDVQGNIALIKGRLELQQTNTVSIQEIAGDVQQRISQTLSSTSINDASFQEFCQYKLDEVEKLLNVRDLDGRYVFGGSNTQVAPCDHTAIPAPNLGDPISYAFNNASTEKLTAQISDTNTIQFDVTAGESGFAKLLHVLTIGANYNPATDRAKLTEASDACKQASDEVLDSFLMISNSLSFLDAIGERTEKNLERASEQYEELSGINWVTVYQELMDEMQNRKAAMMAESKSGENLDWLLRTHGGN